MKCGYNVRGLLPGAMCPECGHPVGASVRDAADWPEPGWLMVLRRGIDLALATIGAWVVSVVIAWPIMGLFGLLGAVFAVAVVCILIPGVALLAAIRFSTPEPMRDDKPERAIARGAAVGVVACYIASLVLGMAGLDVLASAAMALGAAIAILGTAAATYWARHVARRVRARNLERAVFFVGWCDVVVGVVGAGLILLLALSDLLGFDGPLVVFYGLALVMWFAVFFAFGVATVALMVWFRIALSHAIATRPGGVRPE